MTKTFEEAFAAASRLVPNHSAYQQVDFTHPLLSKEEGGLEPILPPEEPTREELADLLVDLPHLIKQTDPEQSAEPQDPEASELAAKADAVLNSLTGEPGMAPDPIDDRFELYGSVAKSGSLSLVYRIFRALRVEKLPITGVRIEGKEFRIREGGGGFWLEEADTANTDGALSYIMSGVGEHSKIKDSDIMIWVNKHPGGALGYILNGWVFQLKR